MSKLRQRLQREEGFTLIELLVVIVIIGILLAIAVPSYLHFRDRAADSAAQANIRAAVPSAEAYFADNQTYVGMTTANLQSGYDTGLKIQNAGNTNHGVILDATPAPSANAYCFQATGATGNNFHFLGGGGAGSGEVLSGACP